jgi:cytochrome c oxidase cbb3-type subunit 3
LRAPCGTCPGTPTREERSTSSRCPEIAALALIAIVALGLTACQREERRFSEIGPSSGQPDRLRRSGFNPGDPPPPREVVNPYEANAWAVSEGKRLFTWFNCVGCHAHGGGGMGPALMDAAWIYGSEPQQVYATIVNGGPNGMPPFGGKLTDPEIWQLVAYVRALSGERLRRDVRPSRDDHLQVRPSEQSGPPPRTPSS